MMTLHSPAFPDTLAAPSLAWLEPLLEAVRNGMAPREAAPYAGMLPAELTQFLDGHYSAALAVALAEADCLKRLLADALAPVIRGTPRRPLAAIKFVLERRFPKAFARLPAAKKTPESPEPAIDPPVPQRRPIPAAGCDETLPPTTSRGKPPAVSIRPPGSAGANKWAGYRLATPPPGC